MYFKVFMLAILRSAFNQNDCYGVKKERNILLNT